jgi:hypothetical protein
MFFFQEYKHLVVNRYDYDRNKAKELKSTIDVDSLVKWQFEFSFKKSYTLHFT